MLTMQSKTCVVFCLNGLLNPSAKWKTCFYDLAFLMRNRVMSTSGGRISGHTGFKRAGYRKSYKESLTGRGFRAVQTL